VTLQVHGKQPVNELAAIPARKQQFRARMYLACTCNVLLACTARRPAAKPAGRGGPAAELAV